MKPANVTDEDVADEAKAQSHRGSGGGEGKMQRTDSNMGWSRIEW